MNNTEYRASPIRLIKIQYIRAFSYTQTSTLRMFSDEGFKCSKFERVKDKAGKRLSHIRFSPYRGCLATREDSRAHPRGLPHCGKNAAKLAINADKAQLFIKILSRARKIPLQAVC